MSQVGAVGNNPRVVFITLEYYEKLLCHLWESELYPFQPLERVDLRGGSVGEHVSVKHNGRVIFNCSCSSGLVFLGMFSLCGGSSLMLKLVSWCLSCLSLILLHMHFLRCFFPFISLLLQSLWITSLLSYILFLESGSLIFRSNPEPCGEIKGVITVVFLSCKYAWKSFVLVYFDCVGLFSVSVSGHVLYVLRLCMGACVCGGG